jgi:hypothetical protein
MKLGHFHYVGGACLGPIVVVQFNVDGFVPYRSKSFGKAIANPIKPLSDGFSVFAMRSPTFLADEILGDIPIEGDRKRNNRIR